MNTVYTSGQLMKLTALMEQQDVTPARFQAILSSGVLADIFDVNADLTNRYAVCKALKLGLYRLGIFEFTIDHGVPFSTRVEALKKSFRGVFCDLDRSDFPDCAGKAEYECRYFELEPGIFRSSLWSKARQEITTADKSNPWAPAAADHMLAFATEHRITRPTIVGLGGTLSVLSGKFQRGIGFGRFLIKMPPNWRVEEPQAREKVLFLAVRRKSD